jgi:hypothetical protein
VAGDTVTTVWFGEELLHPTTHSVAAPASTWAACLSVRNFMSDFSPVQAPAFSDNPLA